LGCNIQLLLFEVPFDEATVYYDLPYLDPADKIIGKRQHNVGRTFRNVCSSDSSSVIVTVATNPPANKVSTDPALEGSRKALPSASHPEFESLQHNSSPAVPQLCSCSSMITNQRIYLVVMVFPVGVH
jgi:hypothetical protein